MKSGGTGGFAFMTQRRTLKIVLRLLILILTAFSGGGCALVRLPLAVAQTAVGAVMPKARDPNTDAARTAGKPETPPPVGAVSSRDRPFSDRIKNPDLTLAYLPAEKPFLAGGSAGVARTVSTREFVSKSASFSREIPTRSYTATRAGPALKSFATKADRIAERTVSGIDRSVATREVATRALPEANRTAATGDSTNAQSNRLFAAKGKRQDALDREGMARKPMSVDDVRALLNKGPKPTE